MAKATPELIEAIRNTAQNLKNGAKYQWGHMGSCNCGHLAQQITKLSKAEIHRSALKRHGDWTEQSKDYCPTSGYLLDDIISMMLAVGLDVDDLQKLEKLSDRNVLARLPQENRYLKHNVRDDVVVYLECWADLLEEEFTNGVSIEALSLQKELYQSN